MVKYRVKFTKHSSADTPYTPVTLANCMNGPACHWLTPRSFHGNPPSRNQPRTHSSVTQLVEATTATTRLRRTESAPPLSAAAYVFAIRALTFAITTAAAAKYRARNAMSATAPGTVTWITH